MLALQYDKKGFSFSRVRELRERVERVEESMQKSNDMQGRNFYREASRVIDSPSTLLPLPPFRRNEERRTMREWGEQTEKNRRWRQIQREGVKNLPISCSKERRSNSCISGTTPTTFEFILLNLFSSVR